MRTQPAAIEPNPMATPPYPESIAWLEPLVRRYGATDLEGTDANLRTQEDLDAIFNAAMRLIADDAAALFAAIDFAESLKSTGHGEESQKLLNVIEASKPVTC